MATLATRIFDGTFSLPPDRPLFHFNPNRLTAGGGTELHEHPHDHLAIFDCSIPGAVYGVEAFIPGGGKVDIKTSEMAGVGVCAIVKAHVRHRVYLKEGTHGAFCCMFSHYDENGCFLPDPKVDLHEPAPPTVLPMVWRFPVMWLVAGAFVGTMGTLLLR